MTVTHHVIVRTRSGAEKEFKSAIDWTRIVGLDWDRRVVVNDFDAFREDRASRTVNYGGIASTESPFLFGLTLCCNASDKGTDWGVCCRSCYGDSDNADEGSYIFMDAERTYDFDPADVVIVDGVANVVTIPDGVVGQAGFNLPMPPTSFSAQLREAGL
jgi:hypothetical protein